MRTPACSTDTAILGVCISLSAAANLGATWMQPAWMVAGLAATAAVPMALHLWPRIADARGLHVAVRLLAVAVIVCTATAVTVVHAATLLGGDPLSYAIVASIELLGLLAAMARAARTSRSRAHDVHTERTIVHTERTERVQRAHTVHTEHAGVQHAAVHTEHAGVQHAGVHTEHAAVQAAHDVQRAHTVHTEHAGVQHAAVHTEHAGVQHAAVHTEHAAVQAAHDVQRAHTVHTEHADVQPELHAARTVHTSESVQIVQAAYAELHAAHGSAPTQAQVVRATGLTRSRVQRAWPSVQRAWPSVQPARAGVQR